jgi:hypothetical protein
VHVASWCSALWTFGPAIEPVALCLRSFARARKRSQGRRVLNDVREIGAAILIPRDA